jgi:hypothetical protein
MPADRLTKAAVAEVPAATPRQAFDRRRRRVNWAIGAMLVLFCLLFYAIAMVKLSHYGLSWIE